MITPADLLDIVLVKYTGLSGRATEVNSISYKSVDSATYLDSIDSLNYPIRAPYGTKIKNISYENWIKFKLRINRKYRKCINGTQIQLPIPDGNGASFTVYTKIKNVKLWVKFSSFEGYEIKYGLVDQYSAPVRTESQIAVTNLKMLEGSENNEDYSLVIPIGDGVDGEMLIGEIEQYTSDYFVSQLTAFKGCEFENTILRIGIRFELA